MKPKNLILLLVAIIAAINPISNSIVYSQTNPVAQTLPFYQDFSGLSYSSKTYPAGFQGTLINSSPSTAYTFDAASADATMLANGTPSSSTKGVYNYGGKIGFLNASDGNFSITLAVKTTGNINLLAEYDIMTVRNPYDGTTNDRINGVELQYRIGTTGSFKSLNSQVYINNTTSQTSGITCEQKVQSFSVKLPAECENQPVVQLRWISRQVCGSGSMPSFAIDNIDVEGNFGKITNYYYKGSGSLLSVANWGINTNGTGTHPVNFTGDNQFFVVKNVSQLSFDGYWTVNGAYSKVIIGDGINPVTFTTVNSAQINGVMDIEKYSTLVISQSTSNLMTFGNLYPGSAIQVLFKASLPYLQAEATYENLLLNSSANHTYQFTIPGANILVKKNFTLTSTLLENTGTDKFKLQVGGDITLSGTAALSSNFSNLAELVINGTGNQTLTANGLALNLNQLTINNGKAGKFILSNTGGSSNINISSGTSPKLNMAGGKIELGTNTVTLGASVSSPGALSYTSGFFTGAGTFARWFANSGLPTALTTLFPMGNDTNSRFVQMSFSTAAITAAGKLSVSHSNTSGLTMLTQPFTENTLRIDRRSNMSWTITQSGGWNLGSSRISLRIFASGLPNINNVGDLSLIMDAAAAGGTYSAGTGSVTFPQVNRTAMSITSLGGSTTGNTFYIGSTTNSPLPVELSSFTSSVKERNVYLSWTTENEVNNSGFDIEKRQADSKSTGFTAWEKIAFVNGNGSSSQRHTYNFSDAGLSTGTYQYRLKQVDYNGNFEYFSLQNSPDVIIGKPAVFELSQNYPNPSNPSTKINYQVPFDGKVSIKVYDVAGKEVATLMNTTQEAGFYSVIFNGADLASGVYFYRLIAEGGNQSFSKTMKMILVK